MKPTLSRRIAAELLGTAFLVIAVLGSGIMAERLSGGNVALALLANAIATGAALVALILAFGPISGAHFNPAVSFADALERGLPYREAFAYSIAQVAGGIAGTLIAHTMFRLSLISLSHHVRSGPAQVFSEFVATFGLISVIWGCVRSRSNAAAFAVGSYIAASYWFTSSTSFANPAVTVARSLTDTFAGIRAADVPLFVWRKARMCDRAPISMAGARNAGGEGRGKRVRDHLSKLRSRIKMVKGGKRVLELHSILPRKDSVVRESGLRSLLSPINHSPRGMGISPVAQSELKSGALL